MLLRLKICADTWQKKSVDEEKKRITLEKFKFCQLEAKMQPPAATLLRLCALKSNICEVLFRSKTIFSVSRKNCQVPIFEDATKFKKQKIDIVWALGCITFVQLQGLRWVAERCELVCRVQRSWKDQVIQRKVVWGNFVGFHSIRFDRRWIEIT